MPQQLPPHLNWRTHLPGPLRSPAHQTWTLPLQVPLLLDIPFVGTPPVGCPLTRFIISHAEKWDHSPSSAFSDQCNKQTYINSQEVNVRSEHSSTNGKEDIPKLDERLGPSYNPQGQGPTSCPSSPTKADTDPGNGTVVGTLKSTRDQDSESNTNHSWASSDSDASRENMADLDVESTSGTVSHVLTQMK